MTTFNNYRPIEILLVEDNPGDVRLTQEAARETKIHNNMHVVTNGLDAMAFLRHEGRFGSVPRPDLILLDLNMPVMDGREVLRQVKNDEKIRRIPVVIITSSQAEEDILRAYDLQASCYVTKPVDLDQFIKVVKHVENFWLTVVTLPRE
jgi:two-component system response regulator